MNRVFKDPQTVLKMHAGPLGPYIDCYAAEMCAEGYAHGSAVEQIRLVADFSSWLGKNQIKPQELTAEHLRSYLRSRALDRSTGRSDHAALKRLLNLLARQGVTPEPSLPSLTPSEQLQKEFGVYLRQERALAASTVVVYLSFVGDFLVECFGAGPVDLSVLCAAAVTGFVQRRAPSIHSKRVQLMTTALRSFLRFVRYRGDVDADLAACVPSVASWSLSTVPKDLPAKQVELALASCNRQTALGRRDFAILLLLARLGLRAGEVAALTLQDLNWQAGSITVREKAGRYSQLPLPMAVGEAIVDYLRNGRPSSSSKHVFLRGRAPASGFKGHEAISAVVKYALKRTGIDSPRKGAHQFRHGFACKMLRQGASLAEIGEILRHRNPQTTAIYAKVDLVSLATLALPWPGGAQ
jgi:integrase/recombinase XerD